MNARHVFCPVLSLRVISNRLESSLHCDDSYITTVLLVESPGDILIHLDCTQSLEFKHEIVQSV